jgi:hypothetical protein
MAACVAARAERESRGRDRLLRTVTATTSRAIAEGTTAGVTFANRVPTFACATLSIRVAKSASACRTLPTNRSTLAVVRAAGRKPAVSNARSTSETLAGDGPKYASNWRGDRNCPRIAEPRVAWPTMSAWSSFS